MRDLLPNGYSASNIHLSLIGQPVTVLCMFPKMFEDLRENPRQQTGGNRTAATCQQTQTNVKNKQMNDESVTVPNKSPMISHALVLLAPLSFLPAVVCVVVGTPVAATTTATTTATASIVIISSPRVRHPSIYLLKVNSSMMKCPQVFNHIIP